MISRISNPSVADQPAPDYMQALFSVKNVFEDLEDSQVEDVFDGSSGCGMRLN